ncbi:hypothetical protein Psi02_38910 [Planotetraspora silvatica]|uniref:Uncharacterized protein n=1 Tax=Planotetraspora silvatica TaxID=234614 RepID=A0A8J3XMI5_9ACTN|nr:hypothetical protein [Planotetraspora silvatica]GII47467.1 hypothetical protein Psi02_38910 [Planotetraspora silvatica]
MSPSVVRAPLAMMLASALVAGCSSSEDAAREAPQKSPTPAPSAPNIAANPLPTKLANDPGIRDNIVQTKCDAVPGGWGAKGTAKNPGTKTVTYKIVVYFTTTKATTLDFAQTLVKVPPGKTVPWSATKHFEAKQQMLCPMPGISVET